MLLASFINAFGNTRLRGAQISHKYMQLNALSPPSKALRYPCFMYDNFPSLLRGVCNVLLFLSNKDLLVSPFTCLQSELYLHTEFTCNLSFGNPVFFSSIRKRKYSCWKRMLPAPPDGPARSRSMNRAQELTRRRNRRYIIYVGTS